MPDDPTVWIIAVLVAGIVVIFALWKGDFVEVSLDPLRLKFKRQSVQPQQTPPGDTKISVGEGMKITNSKTGDIVGTKTETRETQHHDDASNTGNIEVGRNASVKDSETGDIAGIKRSSPDRNEP